MRSTEHHCVAIVVIVVDNFEITEAYNVNYMSMKIAERSLKHTRQTIGVWVKSLSLFCQRYNELLSFNKN